MDSWKVRESWRGGDGTQKRGILGGNIRRLAHKGFKAGMETNSQLSGDAASGSWILGFWDARQPGARFDTVK
jgi:hypothetical protein